MEQSGFIPGVMLAVSILFSAGLCDRNESDFDSEILSGHTAVYSDTTYSDKSHLIRIEKENALIGHEILNTIDWELRQPHDFSSATITTTAVSIADEVKILYRCGDLEELATIVPEDGKIKHIISWNCDREMTATLHAAKGDTLVEYVYSIDIAFLNNLGLN
jgi:hypothetical protein